MSGDGLYERYKDALRRGHVAGLHGRTDEAVAAYQEASAMAPGRAAPHSSRGGVLARAGRLDEALAAYDAALQIIPRDEAALVGRAEALIRANRRAEAADALDLIAGIQEADGRLADACDTARRALEQAESKTRRRHVEALARTLERTIGDQASEVALSRALKVLEGTLPALSHVPVRRVPPRAAATQKAGPPPEAVPPGEDDLPALLAEAEAAIAVDDIATACDRLLAVAGIHLAAHRLEAALDACYQALAIAPAATDIHLALVEAYAARGWFAPAQEKLLLLARLLDLDEDAAGRERLCAVVAARFPDDPRLAALCA